jgi:signal recognition particle receptor subunit beta
MVQFRPRAREIIAKVVYYGPPLGGKTTNLRTLYAGYPVGTRGELVVVPAGGDRTIFFDFLPVDAGTLRGMRMRVQLYTVPGQVHYNATRQVVLRGVDAVVFVADSQRELLRSDRESWENLKDNLALQGLSLTELPHVLQYNKRDLQDVLSVEEMDELLNEFNAPFYEAVATGGIGVEETLQGVVKLVARSLRDRFKIPAEAAGAEIVEPVPAAPVAVPPPPPPLRAAPPPSPGSAPPAAAPPPDLVTPPVRLTPPAPSGLKPPPGAFGRPPAAEALPPATFMAPPAFEPPRPAARELPPLDLGAPPSPTTSPLRVPPFGAPIPEPVPPEPIPFNGGEVFGAEGSGPESPLAGRVMLPTAVGTPEEEIAAVGPLDEALPPLEVSNEESAPFEAFEEVVLPPASPSEEPPARGAFEEAVLGPASPAAAPSAFGAFEEIVLPPARTVVEPPSPRAFEEAPSELGAPFGEEALPPIPAPFEEPPVRRAFETAPSAIAAPFTEEAVLADPFGDVSAAGGGASGDVFQLEPPPPPAVQPEVQFAAEAPPPLELSPEARGALVQRVVPRALAQVGEVRELELEVPVPAVWTGGKRLTLQLRLTLVPEEDTNAE